MNRSLLMLGSSVSAQADVPHSVPLSLSQYRQMQRLTALFGESPKIRDLSLSNQMLEVDVGDKSGSRYQVTIQGPYEEAECQRRFEQQQREAESRSARPVSFTQTRSENPIPGIVVWGGEPGLQSVRVIKLQHHLLLIDGVLYPFEIDQITEGMARLIADGTMDTWLLGDE